MPIPADHIRTTVAEFIRRHPDREPELNPILELLHAGIDVTNRKEFRGHLTASAVVLGPDGTCLLVHHRLYDLWIQPGGHIDPETDETLIGAARRELKEETGLQEVTALSEYPVHISVHQIPAYPARGEDAHQHYDVKFAFTAADTRIDAVQEEEVAGFEWRPIGQISDWSLRETFVLLDLVSS